MLVAMIEQNDRAFYCIDAQHDASVKRFARSGWRHGIRLITDLKNLVLQNDSLFLDENESIERSDSFSLLSSD